VICQHEPGDAGWGPGGEGRGEVGGCAGQGDLDGGRAPGDEVGEVAFADAEEGFVDLGADIS